MGKTAKQTKSVAEKHPECFGVLETVYPLQDDGFRNTPASCFACRYKTDCLRSAMGGIEGLKVKEEFLDRAYESGLIGFLERWARKKGLDYMRKNRKGAPR